MVELDRHLAERVHVYADRLHEPRTESTFMAARAGKWERSTARSAATALCWRWPPSSPAPTSGWNASGSHPGASMPPSPPSWPSTGPPSSPGGPVPTATSERATSTKAALGAGRTGSGSVLAAVAGRRPTATTQGCRPPSPHQSGREPAWATSLQNLTGPGRARGRFVSGQRLVAGQGTPATLAPLPTTDRRPDHRESRRPGRLRQCPHATYCAEGWRLPVDVTDKRADAPGRGSRPRASAPPCVAPARRTLNGRQALRLGAWPPAQECGRPRQPGGPQRDTARTFDRSPTLTREGRGHYVGSADGFLARRSWLLQPVRHQQLAHQVVEGLAGGLPVRIAQRPSEKRVGLLSLLRQHPPRAGHPRPCIDASGAAAGSWLGHVASMPSTSNACRRRVTSSSGMRVSSSCPMGTARVIGYGPAFVRRSRFARLAGPWVASGSR